MKQIQTVNLDMSLKIKPNPVFVKQGDMNTRFIECHLMQENEQWIPDEGVSAQYAFLKPDGKKVYQNAQLEGNVVSFSFSEQCFTAVGTGQCEVILMKEEEVLSFAAFRVFVLPNVYSWDIAESTDEYGAMVSATREAKQVVDEIRNFQTDEEGRISAEILRVQNETERQKLEQERQAAELQRNTEETKRQSSEQLRSGSFDTLKSESEKQSLYAKEQGDYAKLKYEQLQNFDLEGMNDEIVSLQGQINQVNNSISQIDLAIEDDQNRIDLLQLEKLDRSAFVSKNLLINSDFSVNQRGKEAYSAAGADYTYDRWYARGVSVTRENNTSPAVVPYQLKLSVLDGNDYGYVAQPIDGFDQYQGKTVTVSVWMKASSGGQTNISLSIGGKTKYVPITEAWQNVTATFVDLQPGNLLSNGLLINTETPKTIFIAAPQVVLGDYAGRYQVPDPIMNEQQCKRYYQTIPYARIRMSFYSAGNISFLFDIPKMRKKPEIIYGEKTYIESLSFQDQVGFVFSSGTATTNIRAHFLATKASHGLTDAVLYADDDIVLDAELK